MEYLQPDRAEIMTKTEAAIPQQLSKADVENTIRGQLITLIRHAAEHGIDIEALIHEALDIADVEPA